MKSKLLILIVFGLILSFALREVDYVKEKIQEQSYQGEMSNKTKVYAMLGMKKAGAGLILLKQTASIGETLEGNRSIDIKKGSLGISELNPYLLENYYASANVLALIKVYLDYEGALEILNRGLKYNPNDKYLKNYSVGIVASSKGNDDEVLKNYEEIIKKYPDPSMVTVVYKIYLNKAKKDKKFLEKYLYYAEILYSEEKYKEQIDKDLKSLQVN